MKKMKILEVCPYSAGACGVWMRVKQESIELVKKGYEVRAFSSYFEKGSDKIMPKKEVMNGVNIERFPAKKIGGESFMAWNFEKEALEYSPDVIIAHNYRHLHTTRSIKLAEKIRKKKKVKLFLVTHAPFVEGNITRSGLATLIVKIYDRFIGPRTLKKFDKILAISHWEIPYLIKSGAPKEKIVYIPNGIPREFFSLKVKGNKENKVLFFSRISPKKKVETLIESIPFIKNKKVSIELVGPAEEEYFNRMKKLVNSLGVKNRIIFSEPVYKIEKKIKKIDSAKVFVLPSRVEGMPQALIEAMSRGKIVIGSDSIAIRDLISAGKNGYLFEFDNPESLAEKIDLALENNSKNNEIRNRAKLDVKQFNWDVVVGKIEKLLKE